MKDLYFNALKCIDKNRYKEIDIKNFLMCVFEIAKKEFNVNPEIEFETLNSNTWGSSNSKKISINTKFLKLQKLHEISNTIFHEVRHIYQHKYIKKDVNKALTSNIPIFHSNGAIYLVSEQETGINPHYLYYTSNNEKDARTQAHLQTKQLFEFLFNNVKNPKIKRLLKIYINKIEKAHDYENKIYNDCCLRLPSNMGYIKKYITLEIIKVLNNTQHAFENLLSDDIKKVNDAKRIIAFFEPSICAYTSVFVDEDIKTKIINFCLTHSNHTEAIDTLLTMYNSFYCQLDKTDWKIVFGLVEKGMIECFHMQKQLDNYKKDDLQELYKRYKNSLKNAKNMQKNQKISEKTDIFY